ncbi:type VI secretion system Vgr family protein [Roseomonas fluvialis]|uniref:Type VI secretion system tip protein VgrG n=1 Tax=Roseomonas fluvialis TaxID=1750527 RepID=A0ABN6P0Y7_9PROT|nr:type VI secretion system tip protein TssI/VgrG [Roseomonas fluvialis]BDG71418.1 hypothetical protein Rmf_13470 [Roseomonas fluvialis]
MPNYDQSNALLAMHTTLADWPAVLTELEGEDRLSAPFVYRIRFATEAPVAAVKALVGTEVTLFFGEADAEGPEVLRRRPVNGHFRRISRIGRVGRDGVVLEWQAEVVPRLWFLSQMSGFRIFHDQTIPQIVATVLSEQGIDFADRIVVPEAYGTLEYCVQYDESALDFISRLMEHAGIFYWHEHTDVAHTLCFTDNNNNVRMPHPPFDTLSVGDGVLDRLEDHYSFRTGTWTVRDHNLTRPQRAWDKTEAFADVAGADPAVVERLVRAERYRYPGNYMARLRSSTDGGAQGQIGQADADLMATRLIEIEESHWERWTGASAAAGLDAGTKAHFDTDTEAGAADYLVTAIRHRVQDQTCWTADEWSMRHPGSTEQPEPTLSNTFDCMPHAVPFRPDRVTRKPKVGGAQTALVVGPAGQEINVDEFGRVQVQFPWDRPAPGEPVSASAVWIRVSQGWAGGGWGQVHIPRVGHEVIVDFLNGDPDRPIITGTVYNADNAVPHALPAHATRSGIRTRSTPGGTADNANELRFEDAMGAEQVLLHAERDYVVEVENNETRTVGMGEGTGNRTVAIKANDFAKIGGDQTVEVDGNVTETIKGNETITVTGSVTETIGGTLTIAVTGDVNVSSESSITVKAPTITTHTGHHNKYTDTYNWAMGVGYGSFYATVNYQALASTNIYAVSANLVAASFTSGLFSFNAVAGQINLGAWSYSNKAISYEKRLCKIEDSIDGLANYVVVVTRAEVNVVA